jgi:flavodoxin I
MSKIGLFYGTQTGNTELLAGAIQEALGGDSAVDMYDVADASTDDFSSYDILILGCPTWNIGELQSDWDGLLEELDAVDFQGKKVAYFGPGDQVGYSDNFQDAIGIIETAISKLGGTTIGYWPIEGYDFNESKAVRGDKFVGLALDDDNQPEMTDDRIKAWVQQLKSELSL